MKSGKLLIIGLLVTASLGAETKTETHNLTLKNEEELDVDVKFGLGELRLKSCTDDAYLLKAAMEYTDKIFKPVVDYKVLGKRGRLRLTTEKIEDYNRHHRPKDSSRNRWALEITPKIPTEYTIDLGLGEGQLDFTDLKVRNLRLQCGLSDVRVDFKRENRESVRNLNISTGLGNVAVNGLGNANIDRFNVECGLGSTNLVFDGSMRGDARGRISVGLGSVNIDFPDNIAVEIQSEKGFLSSLNLRGFDRVGETLYRSGNWRTAKKRVYMEIEVGLGSVDINWLD